MLDELIKNKNLTIIGCCNELNRGYAADGYARAHGVSAFVVTYSVGGLSSINAVAGAYAQDLPVIVISAAPELMQNAKIKFFIMLWVLLIISMFVKCMSA